jgi:hypothetical protein
MGSRIIRASGIPIRKNLNELERVYGVLDISKHGVYITMTSETTRRSTLVVPETVRIHGYINRENYESPI